MPKQRREDGRDRKRVRVRMPEDVTDPDGLMGSAYAQEVLSAPCLTAKLWHQLFDVYKLHFAAELPFLHFPTLKGIIHDRHSKKPSVETNLILLGILVLTARFQPELVQYVSQITYDKMAGPKARSAPPKPAASAASAASEYFASALTKALGHLESALTSATVIRVQAFLMLGMHKWSQPNGGMTAWMYVGVAIRMAQGLKLGAGDKSLRGKKTLKPSPLPDKSTPLPLDKWKDEEIRRRTMFSCLILDRLLSCGLNRVSMVRSEDLEIQLPCTEHAFDLGRVVNTGFLQQLGQVVERPVDAGVLSHFVQLVDCWGDIAKYSFAGGRRTETHPPWEKESTFSQLSRKVDAFYSHLTEEFTWSSSNFWIHDNSIYVSLHMLGALCRILLHREYLPFIALECHKPMGPLDDPGFDSAAVPELFWEGSAEQVFRAGRDITDLVAICGDRLPHSSLVVFAIWQAALFGLYAQHYPDMDTGHHMVGEDEIQKWACRNVVDITQKDRTCIAFEALNRAARYFSTASNYVTYLRDLNQHFNKVNSDYTRQGSIRSSGGPVTIRQSLEGGGPEEWRANDGEFTSNGITTDEDRLRAYDGSDEFRDSTLVRSSSQGSDYSHIGCGGLDSMRDSLQASSFTFNDMVSFNALFSTEGLSGGMLHPSLTHIFAPIPEPVRIEASIPALKVEDADILSCVRQNQGERFGNMLEDVQEFSTGG
ncbi:putative transcriptional regulatory protein PB1A11.04c 2 [Colletotrichum chlorophyti]|uniref:Putative transcriptional regulatory protein PB1A11.04c 2 n=1 Tax=Colletotrichum chlorophyti TaxID=708187 RepID=A0A1Q8RWY7_9PEZI|nr:putative transcriptional regulatory protein PB1A11.04c 2 [Colletotrichum chlorophyti]